MARRRNTDIIPEPITDPDNITLVNTKQVGHMLGVGTRTVQTYIVLPSDPLPIAIRGVGGTSEYASHQYNIQDVFEWGVRYRLHDMLGQDGDDGPQKVYNGKQEQARLHKEKADGEAFKNKVARMEYAPIELLSDALTNLKGQMGAILGALPNHLKRRYSWLTGKQVELIKTEIIKVQNQVAAARIDVSTLYLGNDDELPGDDLEYDFLE